MLKRMIIRNVSNAELGVMLEPWTDREDVPPGANLILEANFDDDEEIIIDFADDHFLSIWSPPGSKIRCA
jgi:hypothetical protein